MNSQFCKRGIKNVCEEGHECPGLYSVSPMICDVGSYAKRNQEFCTECETGRNCSETGLAAPLICSPPFQCGITSEPQICQIGEYNGLYNQSSCSLCNQGQNCTREGMKEPEICLPGYECNFGIPSICPVGTSNGFQNSSCDTCPHGNHTYLEGSLNCIECEVGAVCFEGIKIG